MQAESSTWRAEGIMANCDPYAIVRIAIQSGSDNALYSNDAIFDGEEPSPEDKAFWNRVKSESKRITAWAVNGLGISGRAEPKMLDKENELRHQYAGMAMQALLPVYAGTNKEHLKACARQAVICADALIAELKA